MSFTVVGSIAFDSIRTPFGDAERELGGSATHAALAGSFFTDVRVVGPVGEDFDDSHYELLEQNGIATEEMLKVRGGRTFEWRGHYDYDLNVAHTDATELNVFEGWQPRLADASRGADTLFLAAMDPETQIDVRNQWEGTGWSALDSNSYWITTRREALIAAVGMVDFVLLNDQEARLLTGKPMLLEAAREITSWGPLAVVLKLGEYGCALLHEDMYFALPGYPLEETHDPTGTGDALAGGFLGYLDRVPGWRLTPDVLRRAVTYGSVMASYCAEDFGARRLRGISEHEVLHRADDFKEMTHFEHVPTRPRPMTGEEAREPRFEQPNGTPSIRPYGSMGGTAGTWPHRSPQRTPSTEALPRPKQPLPRVHPAVIAVPPAE
jgi:sugar/nucleoside kinase (ribokinase family)